MNMTVDVRTGETRYDDPVMGKIVARRARMQCSPAQMRLTLYRAGLLDTVNAIAAADPEAAIVWEYATVIQRQSPFIAALKGQSFTDEAIDALFSIAMAT